MGECLCFDVISSLEVSGRHGNDRKCEQLCTHTTQTQNRKNKKGHSGPLQLVIKMIDMLLHVWVVCVLQNDCKLHNAKV